VGHLPPIRFLRSANGDFHSKQGRRFDPKTKEWIKDDCNQPVRGAGDPKVSLPGTSANGGRITWGLRKHEEASKSEKELKEFRFFGKRFQILELRDCNSVFVRKWVGPNEASAQPAP